MGRLDANSGPSQRSGQNQQPQEYHFQPAATQSPETIDDAPPPFETANDENQQKNSENDPPKEVEYAHQKPTPSRGPMAFPPQSSQPNPSHAAQLPPKNTQMRSPPSAQSHPQPQAFTSTQDEPQAFPPRQDEPEAFPPSQDEPQAFPPSQGKPQAFPPPQDGPQAFPPSQGKPQAFPPPQDGPQAFPPSEGQPQAFPPPQSEVHAFPPRQDPFQQPNVGHFQQGGNFSTMGGGGQMGQVPMHQPMPNSPLVHPNVQVMNTTMSGFPVTQVLPTEAWKSELFGCMDDPTNALITAFCPCVTFGQIAEIIDSGQTTCGTSGMLYGLIAIFIAMPCLLSCTYRTKLRSRYGLMETPAPDWMIHCFCECCALCQEYRELQGRGFDPTIGWLGNVAKSRQQMAQVAAMNPPVKQTMMG